LQQLLLQLLQQRLYVANITALYEYVDQIILSIDRYFIYLLFRSSVTYLFVSLFVFFCIFVYLFIY